MAMFDYFDLDLDYPVDLDYNIPKLSHGKIHHFKVR